MNMGDWQFPSIGDRLHGWASGLRKPTPQFGSDPELMSYFNSANRNAAAGAMGARMSAMRASPNDPSLAAYGQLMGQMQYGQQAQQGYADAAQKWMAMKREQAWQEHMMRLQAKLQLENAKAMQPSGWSQLAGGIGSIGGAALGSWLAPGGFWKGK